MALILLILIASISWGTAVTKNHDVIRMQQDNDMMEVATKEMQKANYFTFVMLVNMAPPHLFPAGNITFLMPRDRTLSKADIGGVVNFLLNHSIPSPLLIDHLLHFPTGSMIPTSRPGFMLKVTNGGPRQFFLDNVRIISPNVCTKGCSIRCHGIDRVVQPITTPTPSFAPAPTSCPNNGTILPAAPLPTPSPPLLTPTPPNHIPPSVVHGGTIYCQIGRARFLGLVTPFVMFLLV